MWNTVWPPIQRLGKLNGFTDDQILEIRTGAASFDPKLNALAALTQSFVQQHGKA